MWGADLLRKGLRWRVANGKRVFFWEDIWLGECRLSLKDGVQLRKEERVLKVSDYWIEGHGWNWLAVEQKISMSELVKLAGVSLCANLMGQDEASMSPKRANSFSVKATYELSSDWLDEEPWPG